ncbi:MAG: class I poly(R)-hydroxyalkanoic acid synthase [Motiliproteus sp.]
MNSKNTCANTHDFLAAMNSETLKLMELFGGKVGKEQLDNLNGDWTQVLGQSHSTQDWIEVIGDYQKSQMKFWSGFFAAPIDASSASSASSDRRFNSDEWSETPIFNYIKDSYLIASKQLNKLAASVGMDDKSQQTLAFYTQQYIDALSPSNFAATNPEVIQRAIDTNGQSLIDGLKNLVGDIGKGRISMTDESAFTMGENIATSEGAVVFENELMQLIQYTPSTDKVCERPLLIVPPCINKFYILDLQPHNSFVRHAVEQGQTVFLISWVNPAAKQGHLSWDDYVEKGIFEALSVAKAVTGSERVNTVAWCVGGTLLASALAVMAARKDNSVASATLLTTLVDFEEPGDLGVFINKSQVLPLIKQAKESGVMSGKKLSVAFNLLRSNDLIWPYVVNNYLKGHAPAPFDILYWNSDLTNMAGEMYSEYLTNMYLENNLIKPGKMTVCGDALDLSQIKVPCYFLSCIEDHIAPWSSIFKGAGLFRNVEFVLGASGHIAGVINPASKNRRHFWTDGEKGNGSEHWLESAEKQEGSWWNHWSVWLDKRGGKRVPAAKQLGSCDFEVIEAAPGRYVKERIA